jgi:hypothetical protein
LYAQPINLALKNKGKNMNTDKYGVGPQAVIDEVADLVGTSAFEEVAARELVEAFRAALATPVSAQPTDPEGLHFNAQRLRNVAALVGLASNMPDDDATLDGARGAVLGQIAAKLRSIQSTASAQPAPTDAKLPQWIDSMKGSDPTMDNVIEWIEANITAPAIGKPASSMATPREMAIAQAVRQACCNCYSPDCSAHDWSDAMADLNLSSIIRQVATNPAAPTETNLTDAEIDHIVKSIIYGDGWDGDRWNREIARAIESAIAAKGNTP